MNKIEGKMLGGDKKIAIVAAKFNGLIVEPLIKAAQHTLKAHEVSEGNIDLIYVPGAFEIPFIVSKLLKHRQYDGIITLGAVIRGETPHFDYVAGECAAGIAQLSRDYETPIVFGVLTVDNVAQALARSGQKNPYHSDNVIEMSSSELGKKVGNKGADAALALIEMIDLCEQI